MIRCEKCGTILESVEVDIFDHEGSDYWCDVGFYEHDNGIYLDLPFNWCGHEFDDDDEDKRECIRCPHCKEYPFEDTEIQTYEFDRVVMFARRQL